MVGRIGRPHGLRGDVTVAVNTDDPDERFAPGAVLHTDPPDRGPLTVATRRRAGGGLLLRFEGVDDREAAEALRGISLTVPAETLPEPDDPDEFYDHQLIGLAVRDASGRELGVVVEVVAPAGVTGAAGPPSRRVGRGWCRSCGRSCRRSTWPAASWSSTRPTGCSPDMRAHAHRHRHDLPGVPGAAAAIAAGQGDRRRRGRAGGARPAATGPPIGTGPWTTRPTAAGRAW